MACHRRNRAHRRFDQACRHGAEASSEAVAVEIAGSYRQAGRILGRLPRRPLWTRGIHCPISGAVQG